MAENYSNYLKVVLFPGDICETDAGILRSDCYTVQHFNYENKRTRNEEKGITYRAEDPTWLECTIRLNTPEAGKQFFEQMQENESFAYSFLFNATFSATNSIEKYEDAMVAIGYIVDIEEVYNTAKETDQPEQMLMHIKMLLNTITFIGKQNNLVLSI